jgi:hypothetical protein
LDADRLLVPNWRKYFWNQVLEVRWEKNGLHVRRYSLPAYSA